MKRALVIGLTLLGLLLCGGVLYFKGKRYEVTITQNQIDAALAERFPASKTYLFVFTLDFTNPEVTLLADEDRIRVGLDVMLNLRLEDEPRNLQGGATLTTALRYDPSRQEFFLDDARFERLEIEGIPAKWEAQVNEAASVAAREFLESRPVYRLEARNAKTAAAKLLLKGLDVVEQEVRVTLGL
ncbi:DUF1439 domain-containing protein [Haloferula sp. A504]|uniref:DUF1439 domain-containing protein n=1 Tax=Haloferula sp. A504 TaxID=3373601 RepID=UPI0031C98B79|nr:DUF1439 domain-containing protein [Verrucomicrobiaceae bacterium E54]